MKVIDIVANYLRDNGFDGLVSRDGKCGCVVDGLCPCEGEDFAECEPGYKVPCTCGEGCSYHIATEKPKENDHE